MLVEEASLPEISESMLKFLVALMKKKQISSRFRREMYVLATTQPETFSLAT